MSHEFGKAKRVWSGVGGYDHWMKTVINVNRFDGNDVAQFRLKVLKHWREHGLAGLHPQINTVV